MCSVLGKIILTDFNFRFVDATQYYRVLSVVHGSDWLPPIIHGNDRVSSIGWNNGRSSVSLASHLKYFIYQFFLFLDQLYIFLFCVVVEVIVGITLHSLGSFSLIGYDTSSIIVFQRLIASFWGKILNILFIDGNTILIVVIICLMIIDYNWLILRFEYRILDYRLGLILLFLHLLALKENGQYQSDHFLEFCFLFFWG